MTGIFTRTEARLRIVGGSSSRTPDDGVVIKIAVALILAFAAIVVLQTYLATGIGTDPDTMAGSPFP